jgi:hypothetical protein
MAKKRTKRQPPATVSEVLRQAILDSGKSFAALERETGVLRQVLMPFARGESGMRLQSVDALAEYFGLELAPKGDRE